MQCVKLSIYINWKASREDERTYSSPLTVIKYLCLRFVRNCYIFPAYNAHKEKIKKNISLDFTDRYSSERFALKIQANVVQHANTHEMLNL